MKLIPFNYNLGKKNNLEYFILYNLNINTINQFILTINEIIKNKSKLNIIIIVDKNSFKISELIFLKNIVINFWVLENKLGIWGLPYCHLQEILGEINFIKFEPILIKENNLFFSLINNFYINSTQLINCHLCFLKNTNCYGFGNKPENFLINKGRLNTKLRLEKYKSIKYENKELNALYNLFINHILNSNLYYSDRYLRLTKVYTQKKELNYDERFVYYCRYLSKFEFNSEKSFLLSIAKNKDFFKYMYENFVENFYLNSLAYTYLTGDIERETFYFYFKDQDAFILFFKFMKISINIEIFEEFYDVSFDFKNGLQSDFKIYTKIKDASLFFDYLKKNYNFEANSLIRSSLNFSLCRRYDKFGEFKGIKFEFHSKNPNEIKKMFFDNYGFLFDEIIGFSEDVFAVDINNGGLIDKITVHYI